MIISFAREWDMLWIFIPQQFFKLFNLKLSKPLSFPRSNVDSIVARFLITDNCYVIKLHNLCISYFLV